MNDGAKFYGEQTSHHPPVTNFLFEGPDKLYRFSGFFEYRAWASGLTTLGGARIGKQIMSFNDGGLISIKDPTIEIGVLTNRTHNMISNCEITDHINKLVATVTYNPKQSNGYLNSFKNKLFKSDD